MAWTVAVTGAGGFIGRRLVERLCQDGHRVRALKRRRGIDAEVEADRLTIVEGSLEDKASLVTLVEGADVVVHLAGLIKARQRQNFFDVNARGVTRLAEAMATGGGLGKLILVSSLAAREPGLSSYAASKRAGEQALLDGGYGFPWTALRPPAVYGPGDPETLPLFKSIQRGFGAMLGGAQARFSLLHVDDLVSAILHVAEPGVAERLVLELDDGAEGGHSWSSMIEAGARVMDVEARRLAVPRAVLATLAFLNTALRIIPGYVPMLTSEKVRELTHQDWVAQGELIRAETAWRPAISIDRGFKATVDWYRLHSLL